MRVGSLKTAQENLAFAAQAYPDSPDVQFQMGKVLSESKRNDEALGYFEKTLLLDANHSGTLLELGLISLNAGNAEKAIDFLSRARSIEPENGEILKSLGEAFVKIGKFLEAIEILNLALKFDETNAETHFLLGKSFEGIGKSKEASEEFERANSLGKRDLKKMVGYDLGRALFDTGKIEEAISEYKKCIKVATDPATGWFELGKIYESKGDDSNSINAFQKSFELDGRSEAQFRIGNIHHIAGIDQIKEEMAGNKKDQLMEVAGSGTEDEREKALKSLLAMDKKSKDALTGLKDLARERGDIDQVEHYIKELKKAGHLNKRDADIALNELTYRSDSGDDLAVWENRLEDAKRHGNWTEAIRQNEKIKKYAKDQLLSWQTFSPKNKAQEEERKAMIKATRYRLKLIEAESKDLHTQKKRH
ncbi:tetratricopeptide repeat protein [bacterium]|nr:tetratricopeptide repeat protein [bacterium]